MSQVLFYKSVFRLNFDTHTKKKRASVALAWRAFSSFALTGHTVRQVDSAPPTRAVRIQHMVQQRTIHVWAIRTHGPARISHCEAPKNGPCTLCCWTTTSSCCSLAVFVMKSTKNSSKLLREPNNARKRGSSTFRSCSKTKPTEVGGASSGERQQNRADDRASNQRHHKLVPSREAYSIHRAFLLLDPMLRWEC